MAPDTAAFSCAEKAGMDSLFVGFDVHKLSISVTGAEEGRDCVVRIRGEVAITPEQVRKLAERLSHSSNRWSSVARPAAVATGFTAN